MDIKIPKNLYNTFNSDIELYQLSLLEKIYNKYLINKIDFNEIKNDLTFKKTEKPKFVIKKKQVPDELRCCAKVWINGKGERCNKHKKDGIDYCKVHLYKRNYGRFDIL